MATLKGSFKIRDFEAGSTDPLDRMTTKQVVKILTESFLNSEFHDNALADVLEINQIEGSNLESSGSKASFFQQSFILTQRSFVNMARDIGYYWLVLWYASFSLFALAQSISKLAQAPHPSWGWQDVCLTLLDFLHSCPLVASLPFWRT